MILMIDIFFQQRPHQLIQMILENHQLKLHICELEYRIQTNSSIEEMSSNIQTPQNHLNLIDNKINEITNIKFYNHRKYYSKN